MFLGSFESIFIEIQSTNFKALVGEIYRVPNTNEANSLAMYENILKNLQNYKHNIIIGTDQNFDYIKLEQHKNTDTLLGTFLINGLVPTITKPTRITHNSATLIDNIYISIKNKGVIKSAILCADISDHLPVFTCVGKKKRSHSNKSILIQTRSMTKNTIRNIADKIRITDWKYLEQMNANDAYTEFENALNNIINSIAPEKNN